MAYFDYQIAAHDNASTTAKHYHDISISTLNELAKNNIPSNAIVSSVQIHFRASISSGDTKFYVGWTNDGSKKPGSSFISGQLTTTPTSYYYNITSFSSTYPFNISSSYSKIGFYASSGIIIKGYMCSDFRITYTYSIPTYTATFLNWDGTLLYSTTVESGKTPTYGGVTPTKDSTAQYDYTFSGWSPAVGAVYSNTTYTAQFTETLREYEVVVTCSEEPDSKQVCTVLGGGKYKFGDVVTLQAVDIPPLHGFIGWLHRVGANTFIYEENPYTFTLDWFTVDPNYSTLEFRCLIEYIPPKIKAAVLPNDNAGSVEVGGFPDYTGDEKYYVYGTGVIPDDGYEVKYRDLNCIAFRAIPNEKYIFLKWSDGNTENPRRLMVTGDETYIAIFEKLPPEFISARMTYLDKQISNTNKVIANQSFVISFGVI